MGVLSGEQPGNREDSGRNWEGPPTGGTSFARREARLQMAWIQWQVAQHLLGVASGP